jgi:hypothetical protein
MGQNFCGGNFLECGKLEYGGDEKITFKWLLGKQCVRMRDG